MRITTYRITNTSGKQGRAWTRTYASQGDAEDALRDAMGWDGIALSDEYAVDDGDGAWSAYATQEECDADEDGAYAPRIIARAVAVDFSADAMANLVEAGAIPADDLCRLRAGDVTDDDLLAECLSGAEDDRVEGWRDYVAALSAVVAR